MSWQKPVLACDITSPTLAWEVLTKLFYNCMVLCQHMTVRLVMYHSKRGANSHRRRFSTRHATMLPSQRGSRHLHHPLLLLAPSCLIRLIYRCRKSYPSDMARTLTSMVQWYWPCCLLFFCLQDIHCHYMQERCTDEWVPNTHSSSSPAKSYRTTTCWMLTQQSLWPMTLSTKHACV